MARTVPEEQVTGASAPRGDGPAERPSSAAGRALAEAAERRAKAAQAPPPSAERNGRGGLDPVRYGDWEIKGMTSDF